MVVNDTIISLQTDKRSQPVRIASKEYTKKGRRQNVKHVFIAPLCSRLWATPGVFFVSKSLSSASRMALRKVQSKKRPSVSSTASTRTISSICWTSSCAMLSRLMPSLSPPCHLMVSFLSCVSNKKTTIVCKKSMA